MEWSKIVQESSSSHHSSLGAPITPQYIVENTQWTYEENKLFENALAEFDQTSQNFFHNVASKIPRKTIEDVKKHYESLVIDIDTIECGRVPTPVYRDHDQSIDYEESKADLSADTNDGDQGSSSRTRRVYVNHQRRKALPWTEAEHQLFLVGLNKYGKGDWKSISRYCIVTKSPTQVASHAQKFFRRRNSSTPADKRRPSINNIQTVNSTSITLPQRHRKIPLNTGNPFPSNNNYYYHKANEITEFGEVSPILPPKASLLLPIDTTIINPQLSGHSDTFLGNQP